VARNEQTWQAFAALALLQVACASTGNNSAPAASAAARSLYPTAMAQGLARLTWTQGQELWPAPSPDGTRLLFAASTTEHESTLMQMDLGKGAAAVAFTPSQRWSTFPAWLPDGATAVYVTNASGDFALVSAEAGKPGVQPRVLSSQAATPSPGHPTSSPDGLEVCFSARVHDVPTLAVVRTDSLAVRYLVEGDYPAWSPDGKTLAFSRWVDGNSQIFTLDVAPGAVARPVTAGAFNSGQPAWSPDSTSLVFISDRSSAASNGGQQPGFRRGRGMGRRSSAARRSASLFVARADGTAPVPLTMGDADVQSPAWSRDGWIYFSSNQAGDFDIWRLQLASPATSPQQAAPQAPSAPGL
jgi:TolB protein